jgi:SAM-dependent methyltransferase
VLDVGCGTGRLAAELAGRGAKVWGVDTSEEMLEQARRRLGGSVGLKLARAEALPFRAAWFERVVLRCVVHLVDRARAIPEVARVLAPGGKVVIATFRPEHFDRIWVSRYFPSLRTIDLSRFPACELLAGELRAAGFSEVRIRALSLPATIGREEALERIRHRYISTLSLIPEDEYRAGLARAEEKLGPEMAYSLEWAIVVAERP